MALREPALLASRRNQAGLWPAGNGVQTTAVQRRAVEAVLSQRLVLVGARQAPSLKNRIDAAGKLAAGPVRSAPALSSHDGTVCSALECSAAASTIGEPRDRGQHRRAVLVIRGHGRSPRAGCGSG